MSTIKVNKLENTATANGGISIDNTGHVQVDGMQMPTAGPLSNRNMIINGAMQVAQRGTSAIQIGTGTYNLDRYRGYDNTSGTFTVQQVSDAPDGFKNSAKVTVTTAASSISASHIAKLQQRIEGQNVIQLGLGTSAAKTFTLSFYVKASVTGTYAVGFINGSNNRSYVANYSISSANTWEYKTITVQGDTSGTWANDNTTGLNVQWSLGMGSNFEAAAGEWHTSEKSHTTSAVDLISTLNATWQITGIQLEVGSKATPFEHESHGQVFTKCQRYYEKAYIAMRATKSADHLGAHVTYQTYKRTSPSIATDLTYIAGGITTSTVTFQTWFNSTKSGVDIQWNAGSGTTYTYQSAVLVNAEL